MSSLKGPNREGRAEEVDQDGRVREREKEKEKERERVRVTWKHWVTQLLLSVTANKALPINLPGAKEELLQIMVNPHWQEKGFTSTQKGMFFYTTLNKP